MMNKKDKHGELTSRQIVIIVILIISFAAILIFFFSLNLKSEISTETCRNSVVLRGLPGGSAVSLNCKTQDVCFSKDGGVCDSAREDVVEIEVDDRDELLDELVDLAYLCYWQMGSGEIDYASANLGFRGTYCAICNNIYFEDSLKKEDWINSISQREYYDRLATTDAPGGENSLLFEMYGLNNVNSQIFENQEEGERLLGLNYAFDYDNGWVLVTGLNKGGYAPSFIATAAGGATLAIVGVALALPSAGTSLSLTAVGIGLIAGAGVGSIVGGGIGLAVAGPGNTEMIPPTPYPNDPKTIQNIGCYEFESLP